MYDFWLPQNVIVSVGDGFPANMKIHACSSPVYKMVESGAYSWSAPLQSPSGDSKIPFSILIWLGAKPRDTKGEMYIYWKTSPYKWTYAVQSYVVQGSTAHGLNEAIGLLWWGNGVKGIRQTHLHFCGLFRFCSIQLPIFKILSL